MVGIPPGGSNIGLPPGGAGDAPIKKTGVSKRIAANKSLSSIPTPKKNPCAPIKPGRVKPLTNNGVLQPPKDSNQRSKKALEKPVGQELSPAKSPVAKESPQSKDSKNNDQLYQCSDNVVAALERKDLCGLSKPCVDDIQGYMILDKKKPHGKKKLVSKQNLKAVSEARTDKNIDLLPCVNGMAVISKEKKQEYERLGIDLTKLQVEVDEDTPEELKKLAKSINEKGLDIWCVSDQTFAGLMGHLDTRIREFLQETKTEAQNQADKSQQCQESISFLKESIEKIEDKEAYFDRKEFEKLIEGAHSLIRGIPDGLAFFTSGVNTIKSKDEIFYEKLDRYLKTELLKEVINSERNEIDKMELEPGRFHEKNLIVESI